MVHDRRLSRDFQVGCRAGQRSGASEDVQRERRSLEQGLGSHLNAVLHAGAVIKRDRASLDSHLKKTITIFSFYSPAVQVQLPPAPAAFPRH